MTATSQKEPAHFTAGYAVALVVCRSGQRVGSSDASVKRMKLNGELRVAQSRGTGCRPGCTDSHGRRACAESLTRRVARFSEGMEGGRS